MKSSLESERDALQAELSSVSSSRDTELSALRAELESRVSDRESEIARVQSELAETKSSLESERDALQAQLVELSSAQDEELATTLAAQLSERDAEIARVQSELAEMKSSLESERDALQAELSSVSSSRDAELSALRAELESRVSDRESEIARVQFELEEARALFAEESAALRQELETTSRVVAQVEQSYAGAMQATDQSKKDLDENHALLHSLEERVFESDAALVAANETIVKLEKERDNLEAEIEGLRADLIQMERSKLAAEAETIALRDELSTSLRARSSLEADLSRTNDELERSLSEQTRLASENSQLRSELLDAKALADDYTRQLSAGMFDSSAREMFGVLPMDSFDVSQDMNYVPDKVDEVFIRACNSVQRIEIITRRQQQSNHELQRLVDLGDGASQEAQMLRTEIEVLSDEIDSCRRMLSDCSQGLSMLESRMSEELAMIGKSPLLNEEPQVTQKRLRKLEQSLAIANAESSATFQTLESELESSVDPGKDIPVEFTIPFETQPGQRLLVVGTWCDWIPQAGLELTWVRGNVWKGTMLLHTGSNYEYKYVVAEEVRGALPGDTPPYWPSWGKTDPELEAMFSGGAHMLTWQPGNNKAMALDNIHTTGVAHIKVADDWIANPKNSPITLFSDQDELIEIVGSTALLGETVDRADRALAEARKQVEMMAELASAALAEVDTQLAKQVSTELDKIRRKGSLESDADGKHHRPREKTDRGDGDGDEPFESKENDVNWMNIGYGFDEARETGFDSSPDDVEDFDDDVDGIDLV